LSIATATLEQLRGIGLSITQAKRVIDYRDRSNGIDSLDDLERMPGFSKPFLAHLKERLTL